MVCYVLCRIFVCSWKHPESSKVPVVSSLVLVCCLLLLFLDRLWKCSEFPSKLTSLIMPRLRGISRQGSHSGNRGQPSRPTPEIVPPMAIAPPSNPHLDHDRLVPNNSHRTSRFVFHSRPNKPVVTVTFTISVSEEDSIQLSSPVDSSSHSQDASVLLGDMTGIVFHVDQIQEDPPDLEMPQHAPVTEEPQHAPVQDDTLVCGPAQPKTQELYIQVFNQIYITDFRILSLDPEILEDYARAAIPCSPWIIQKTKSS